MNALVRAAILTATCVAASSVAAQAEVLFTPFVGKTFAAQNTLPAVVSAESQAWTVGGTATWLTNHVLGAELDFGYAPRFFKSDRLATSTGGNVISLTGNVVLALPLSVTRESLRPYVSGGMGVIHAGADDRSGLFTLDRNLLGVSIGGGAIGFVNSRAGVRFDLRYIRSTSEGVANATLLTEPRLSFWRATIGVAIRY